MYEVVGCSACHAIWIREGPAATATCPRCQKRHDTDRLRTLAAADDPDIAREARSELLAARNDAEDALGYLETAVDPTESRAIEDSVLDAFDIDNEQLEAANSTGRPSRQSRQARIRSLIETLDHPTETELEAAAQAFGIDPEDTRTVLDALERTAAVIRDGDGYRLV